MGARMIKYIVVSEVNAVNILGVEILSFT
jgi:hypothetical protein